MANVYLHNTMGTFVISPEVFLERYAHAIQNVYNNPKIAEILALDCFNDKANFVPKRRVHQVTPPSSLPVRQKEKTLSYHDKLIREVIGNINKINTSNFKIICNKIHRIIDANNVAEITSIVLETASGPHHIYMEQLMNMLNNFPAPLHEIKMATIREFAQNSIDGIDAIITTLNEMEENYDNFCKTIKAKSHLAFRWIMLYKLFNSNQIDIQPETMFEKLRTNLITHQSHKVIQTHLLDMMLEFFRMFKADHPHCYLLFLETIEDNDMQLTTKGNFIYKDIISMK